MAAGGGVKEEARTSCVFCFWFFPMPSLSQERHCVPLACKGGVSFAIKPSTRSQSWWDSLPLHRDTSGTGISSSAGALGSFSGDGQAPPGHDSPHAKAAVSRRSDELCPKNTSTGYMGCPVCFTQRWQIPGRPIK